VAEGRGTLSGERVRHLHRDVIRARFLVMLVALSVLVGACAPQATTRQPTPTPFVSATTSSLAPAAAPALTSTPATATKIGALPTPGQTPRADSPTPANPTRTPTSSGAAAVVDPTSLFSADQAFAHVRHLAGTIGSRPASDENYRIAAEYVANELRAYGYSVQHQEFTYSQVEDRGSGIQLLRPTETQMTGRALAYSGVGDVTAPLVAAGLGRRDDFAGKEARGKIAVIERGEITFRDKVTNALAAGAVGVVIFNNQEGNFSGSLVAPVSIPVLGIDGAGGRVLRDTMASGPAEARLVVQRVEVDLPASNVVAAGDQAFRGPTIVLGGHLDSVPAGPGANDNASGVGTMLEIARVMAGRPEAARLVFIAFGAEELGLHGSRHYVSSLADRDRQAIALMINMDMVGVGDRFEIGAASPMARGIAEQAGEIARALGAQPRVVDASPASDHAPFAAAGVPAIFLHWRDDPDYHLPTDVVENVQPELLKMTGQTAIGLLEHVLATS
jgi:aminopeptidase YwaD